MKNMVVNVTIAKNGQLAAKENQPEMLRMFSGM